MILSPAPGSAVEPPAALLAVETWRPAPADLDLDQPAGSQVLTLRSGAARILLVAAPHLPVPLAEVRAWVARGMAALTVFYGHFPVDEASVVVLADGGEAVHGGVTHDGRRISVRLGAATTAADLADDWVITHEMFHLAIPDVGEGSHWLEEGAASYFEPLARARAGQLAPAVLWRELIEGAPQGQPERGDRGLDRTRSWGRTYWGGTLFWLLADLDIRDRTAGRKSADDVLRGLLAAGDDGSTHLEPAALFAAGDRFVGLTALTTLHARQGPRPETVDLARLWRRLGVSLDDGTVHFDDGAEWAGLRRAMTAVPTPP
ncbi:MAG: hypothetical protein H0X38_13290 [Planctomycetes bacterium]|nr:hypothetical protein [Planctomycetota bacterium]